VTSSIGISQFLINQQGVEYILKQADAVMYQAKSNGRNNFGFFNASMPEHENERLRGKGGLRKAIDNDEQYRLCALPGLLFQSSTECG